MNFFYKLINILDAHPIDLLKENRTLTNVNAETNKITGEAMKQIAEAIQINVSSMEFH